MSRPDSVFPQALQFQRAEGKARLKKAKQGMSPPLKRALLAFGLVAVIFVAVHQITLFLISWKNLEVRNVQVACANETVRAEVVRLSVAERWGNILLLDLTKIQRRIEAYPWVKEARLRKVFPSSVQMDVAPRVPVALLQRHAIYLIDRNGVELEPANPGVHPGLPLLRDDGVFDEDRKGKIQRAWECLDGLADAGKADVETIDLSDPANAVLKFRSGPTRLFLGDERFGSRIAGYLKNKDIWTKDVGGVLEYVDLRFEDRVYVKAAPPAAESGAIPSPHKETR